MIKKTLFLLSILLIGLMSIGVNALTCSIITPASSGILNIGTLMNVSFTDAEDNETVRVDWNFTSTTTANTSNIILMTEVNVTQTDRSPNGSINLSFPAFNNQSAFEDGLYTVEASVSTGDGVFGVECGTLTNVIVDRNTPAVPTTTQGADSEVKGSSTLTYTVQGVNTTACRIAFLDNGVTPRFTGTNTFAMTHSGNTCTYTLVSNTIPDNTYDVYTQASDGSNTSVSAKLNLRVKELDSDLTGGIGDISVPIAETAVKKKRAQTIFTVILIGVLIYAAFFRKTSKK